MIICINHASMSNIICVGAGEKVFVHLSKLYFAGGGPAQRANIFK